MCKRLLILLLLLLQVKGSRAIQYAYEVAFTDKNGTKASLDNPASFLSQRSLDRRARYQISLDQTDLPVSRIYLDSLVTITGGKVNCASRWLNLCILLVTDTSGISSIRALTFVRSVKLSGVYTNGVRSPRIAQANKTTTTGYGNTLGQTTLVNGQALHNIGYKGNGILIAVMDAGFIDLPVIKAFDSMRLNGRIIDQYNINLDTPYIYAWDNHGTKVLSTLAGYVPDTFVGTAPFAQYALYVTEDKTHEQPVELVNMVVATERADSIGADVISSSLGYNTFDNPAYDFVFSRDFDGHTTNVARAANLAVSKGIIFVTSAGNEGLSSWKYVLTPGDADSAITVGSVDLSQTPASTSGYGPNAAGKVKPELCALGRYASIVGPLGYATEDGTSFSTPQIAGWAACLLQSAPHLRPGQIKHELIVCASHYASPGAQIGYGVPDLGCTEHRLSISAINPGSTSFLVTNTGNDRLFIKSDLAMPATVSVTLFDMAGRKATDFTRTYNAGVLLESVSLRDLPAGIYILRINNGSKTETVKVAKY